MKKIFKFISSTSSLGLFFIAIGLSIFLTGSFFAIVIYAPELFLKDTTSNSLFYNLTLPGKLYILSGIIPNFLILVIILRFINLIITTFVDIMDKLVGLTITEKNIAKFNNTVDKIEGKIISQKPKIKDAVNKVKFKTNIKNEHLTPIALIISAIIIASAILLQ